MARFSGFDKSILVLAVSAGLIVFSAWRSRANRNQPPPVDTWEGLSGLLWPTLGAACLLLVHGLARWMYVPWYFVPLTILLILWFGVVLAWVSNRKPLLALGATAMYIGFQIVQGAVLWEQGGMWATQARVARDSMPRLLRACEEHDTIGISDTGYYAYFLPCRVVNLDGVVNNRAFEAIRQGRFRDYLDEAGIGHVELNHIVRDVVAIREGAVPDRPPFSE